MADDSQITNQATKINVLNNEVSSKQVENQRLQEDNGILTNANNKLKQESTSLKNENQKMKGENQTLFEQKSADPARTTFVIITSKRKPAKIAELSQEVDRKQVDIGQLQSIKNALK